ncbi:MAG: ATP-binding protein [Vulcanimicrobiota bacterium]
MSVRDWMTPDPVTVGANLRLGEALHRMTRHGVKFLPIVDGGRLVGVLSGKTILDTLIGEPDKLQQAARRPAIDFIQKVDPLRPDTENEAALGALRENAFSLPVVDGDRLVGVVSQGNLLRFLDSELTGRPVASARHVANTRIDVLLSVVRETSTSQDQQRLLEVVCAQMATVMPVARAALMLLPTPESNALLENVYHVEGKVWEGHTGGVPLQESLSGWVATHGESLRIPDLARMTRYPRRPESWNDGSGASLSAPLLDQSACLGVLHFWSPQVNCYLDADLELLELVAAHVVSAVLHGRRLERETRLVAQLQQANRIKDEFLAVVTHDLRNALQGIMAYTQILQKKAGEGKLGELAGRVAESARYMADLTNDLHDFGRLGLQALKLNPSQVDLNDVVTRVFEEAQELAQSQSVELRPPRFSQSITISADPLRLRQILANLVSNAIKYNRTGGWVEVRTRREANQAVIEVEDSGRGIAAADQQKVFDLFGQANDSRKVLGSGLGLTITRRLVELHDGKMELESQLDKGSLFRVRLPA